MSSLGVAAFNNIGKGNSVRGSVDLAASMALAARLEAMSYGLGSKLVIDNDDASEYKLRRMAIFRGEGNDPSNPVWAPTGKAVTLVNGSYFLSSTIDSAHGSTNGNQPDEDFPLPGSASTSCIVYEFDGSGHLKNPGRLVFVSGIMSDDGTLTVPDALLQGRSGFRLPANGRPAFFQNPDQIVSP